MPALPNIRKPRFVRPACRETASDPVREGFNAQQVRFPFDCARQPYDTEFCHDRRHQLVIDVRFVHIEQLGPDTSLLVGSTRSLVDFLDRVGHDNASHSLIGDRPTTARMKG